MLVIKEDRWLRADSVSLRRNKLSRRSNHKHHHNSNSSCSKLKANSNNLSLSVSQLNIGHQAFESVPPQNLQSHLLLVQWQTKIWYLRNVLYSIRILNFQIMPPLATTLHSSIKASMRRYSAKQYLKNWLCRPPPSSTWVLIRSPPHPIGIVATSITMVETTTTISQISMCLRWEARTIIPK